MMAAEWLSLGRSEVANVAPMWCRALNYPVLTQTVLGV